MPPFGTEDLPSSMVVFLGLDGHLSRDGSTTSSNWDGLI